MEKQNSTNKSTLSDKAFCRLMLSALLSTILAITIFCGTTYAWFTTSTRTTDNTIMAGDFLLDITVTDSQNKTVFSSEKAKGGEKFKSFSLEAGDTYTVTLVPGSATSVSKGHAAITIGGVSYKTDTIYRDAATPFSFTIVTDKKATVSVKALWGMAAQPTIVSGLRIQG